MPQPQHTKPSDTCLRKKYFQSIVANYCCPVKVLIGKKKEAFGPPQIGSFELPDKKPTNEQKYFF